MIDLRLLGTMEVHADDQSAGNPPLTQPKRVALLIYLALAEPAGLHSRDRLLALLWPEADDASSRHSLRNALHGIRQALGDDVIVTRGEAQVGLDFSVVRCDVLVLRAHLAAGRLDEALQLWIGEPAPGFHVSRAPDFERWLDNERATLGAAVRGAAWRKADLMAGTGARELTAVRQAVRVDPGNETGARRLMRLLASAGDRSGALKAYEALESWFAHELDAVPSEETRQLANELRGPEPAHPVARRRAIDDAPFVSSPVPDAQADVPDVAWPASRRLRRTATALLLGLVLASAGVAWLWRDGSTAVADPVAEARRAVLHLPARYRADTASYSSYLRGLTLRFQFHFAASRDTMAALVDRNPLYVPGLYGLAHAWIFLALNDMTDWDDAWLRIRRLSQRALALDSTAASAWLALASEDMFGHMDLARASVRIDQARALDSLDADAAGMRSVWFRFHAEMDSAVAWARTAHRLDPLSVYFERLVAKQLFFARQYDESRRLFMRSIQNNPDSLRIVLDMAALSSAAGHPREAVTWLRRVRVLQGDSAGAAALHDAATDMEATRLLKADARRTLERLDGAARAGERTPASHYALAYAALGDTARTLAWLDSILVQRDSYMHQIRVDPALDFVRSKPEYRAWEERAGLPAMSAKSRLPAPPRQDIGWTRRLIRGRLHAHNADTPDHQGDP
jgi:DNA-binding SARP family transcriptional activator